MIEKDKRELANLKLEEKNLKDVVQKLGGIYSSVQTKVDFHMHRSRLLEQHKTDVTDNNSERHYV